MDAVRLVVSLLLPPVGVFMQERLNRRFWTNVVLTMLGYIPGVIHAAWVIFRHEPRLRGRGGGRSLPHPAY
jgi:uncharacterized membrane protein YqaE (UPF0057 family)